MGWFGKKEPAVEVVPPTPPRNPVWLFGNEQTGEVGLLQNLADRVPKWMTGKEKLVLAPDNTGVSPLKPQAPEEPTSIQKVKCYTDHGTGSGIMAITGRFNTNGDKIILETARELGPYFTAHGQYGVTDERLLAFGLESRFQFIGVGPTTIDCTYIPSSDLTSVKTSLKLGNAKLSAYNTFDGLRDRRIVYKPSPRFELDAKLSATEQVKLAYNLASNAIKMKLARRLDSRNRLNLELLYSGGGNGRRYGVVSLNHKLNKRHTINIESNYGSRKYSIEWQFTAEGGPWTVATDFSYDKSPHIGDWRVKRRFEF